MQSYSTATATAAFCVIVLLSLLPLLSIQQQHLSPLMLFLLIQCSPLQHMYYTAAVSTATATAAAAAAAATTAATTAAATAAATTIASTLYT
jgi:hypothetical protein